jgi:hypothetical protein
MCPFTVFACSASFPVLRGLTGFRRPGMSLSDFWFGDDGETEPGIPELKEDAAPSARIFVTLDHFRQAAEKTVPSVSRDQKKKYLALRDKLAGIPTSRKRKWLEAQAKDAQDTPALEGPAIGEGVLDRGMDVAS